MKKTALLMFAVIALACAALAQDTPTMPPPPPHGGMHGGMRGMLGPGLHMPPGRWWKDSGIAAKLSLTDQQASQIDTIFQSSRQQLETAGRELKKDSMALGPMINTDPINDAQVNAQLDLIAQARSNLEKVDSQMLLAIRKVLTLDQWKQLQSIASEDFRGFARKKEGFAHRQQGTTPPPPPDFF